jgi:RNA polymerase sigma-70 factor (ECF subfamily)
MSTDELTELAILARGGDSVAVTAFVTATQADVWRFCAHLVGHRYADDLTQETYLRAFAALPRFAARSKVRTWLLSIARRVAADHHRTTSRRPRTTGDDWRGAAERRQPRVPGIADAVILRDLVWNLPYDRREAFVLTQVIGLSYAEAAVACQCPVGTIRSRVARAREELIAAIIGNPATRASADGSAGT